MHMIDLQRRILAPDGRVVSGTGASRPIPVKRGGKSAVAGFLYEWLPPQQRGGPVQLVSPERLYVFDAATGDLLEQRALGDGGRVLGPATPSAGPLLPLAERESHENLLFARMDRLFAAFARGEPRRSDLEGDARDYCAEFKRSTDPALLPFYRSTGPEWFEWVGCS